MKIVCDAGHVSEAFIDELRREFPDATLVRTLDSETARRELRDAEAFVGWPDRDAFVAATRLRWIHNMGTGIDRLLQVEEIAASDVMVTNAPGPHTNPMADHALAMMLAFSHRVPQLLDDQRAKRWDTAAYSRQMLELNGSVLGLLSLGGVGRAVAQRALAFGMQVYAVDPTPTDIPAGVRDVWDLTQLDNLLAMADWVVVTSPLVPGTRGLLDARRLGLMQSTAHLIVVSRGGIVDEAALAAALGAGRLAGAALDATAVEPLPADSPLWGLPNVIISPHVSAGSPRLSGARRRILRENIRRFIDGQPLAFVCDTTRGY